MVDVDELMHGIHKCIFRQETAKVMHIDSFAELLKENPDQAIDMIFDTYHKALDDADTDADGNKVDAHVKILAGGPFEAIPWAVYNVVGSIYPSLEREQKDRALKQILNILDHMNYGDVNGARGSGHTTGIREPLLLADITLPRVLYWPGLDEGKHLIEKYPTFFEFKMDLIDENGIFKHQGVAHDFGISGVNSDFVVAYALLRSDYSSWAEEYMEVAKPSFLERTVKGIVARRFGRAENQEDIQKGEKRLKELLPESLHDKITPLREQADWVDYKKFQH